MKRHINIPIFIPHLGCPNQCVFCNQRSISGVEEFRAESVIPLIEQSLKTAPEGAFVEIAFFGGSFTGIDRGLMISLLSIAKRYIDLGLVHSVRCSTRPDYIDAEILGILKEYGVKVVELGLQSHSERVLDICKRGHTAEDEERACRMILEAGLIPGGQMMIGLPSSSVEDEIETARFIVSSGCKEARIYPTVVFKGTELCRMSREGQYRAPELSDAVERSARAFEILLEGGVRILRVGLCDSENLHSEQTYEAGPNHPAMGELVENRYFYNKIAERLSPMNAPDGVTVIARCAKGHTSKVIGQNQMNKTGLAEKFGLSAFKVREDGELQAYTILLEIQERK